MRFYTSVLQFYLKNWQKKTENDIFLGKKKQNKNNSATIMISVDGKGSVFPIKLKLQGTSFENILEKKEFQKESNEFN